MAKYSPRYNQKGTNLLNELNNTRIRVGFHINGALRTVKGANMPNHTIYSKKSVTTFDVGCLAYYITLSISHE